MHKPISEWPASLITAFLVTLGCGFVISVYLNAASDEWGQITLPVVLVASGTVAIIGTWIETVLSFLRWRTQRDSIKASVSKFGIPGRVSNHWQTRPAPHSKTTDSLAKRVYNIDD